MSKLSAKNLLELLETEGHRWASGRVLAARVEKVLELHVSATHAIGAPVVFDGDACAACGELSPCPTRRLLDGEEA